MSSRIKGIITRVFSSILVAGITLTGIGLHKAPTVRAEGFETASEAVGQISIGWNLGNTLDSYGTWINGTSPNAFETAWGNPTTTKAMIDSVRDQGFNAIRIPVTWSQHIDGNGNVDSAWMSRVKEVVNYAYDDGLYVILNVHHDSGEGGGDKVSWIFAENSTYSSTKTKYEALWTNIANEFKDYGERLLFEGYNEMLDANNTWNAPGSADSYEAVNSYAQSFVNAVRATGGANAERNLIVNTYVSSVDQACLNNFSLPNDSATNHLICEVHVYAPWGFTGTHAAVNWTTVHNDFGSSDKSEIDGIMSRLKSFSDSKGVPVIIGEFGAEYKNNRDQIVNYARYFVDAAGKQGIKCFYWDNGQIGSGNTEGGYGIFNRSNLTWVGGIAEAMVEAAAPYVVEKADVPEETEPSETEETTETTEATTVETTVIETSEVAETTVETTVSEGENAPEKRHSAKGIVVFAIVDVVLVAGAVATVMIYQKKRRK